MKRSKHSDGQIAYALRQAEAGTAVADGCHATLPRSISGCTKSSIVRTTDGEQKGPDEATLDRLARAHLAVVGMWQDRLNDDGTRMRGNR